MLDGQQIEEYGQRRAQNVGYVSTSVPVPLHVLGRAMMDAMAINFVASVSVHARSREFGDGGYSAVSQAADLFEGGSIVKRDRHRVLLSQRNRGH